MGRLPGRHSLHPAGMLQSSRGQRSYAADFSSEGGPKCGGYVLERHVKRLGGNTSILAFYQDKMNATRDMYIIYIYSGLSMLKHA